MMPLRSCPRIGRHLAAGLGALFLGGAPALASSFQVSPVKLTLSTQRAIGSLSLRNADAAPVSVKVVTYRWTQVAGVDVYTPTDDLIASPPIFTTAGMATQIVRVGLRHRVASAAYRVILEEIPTASTTGAVQIALRINLPMYVQDAAPGKAAVRWAAWRDAAGELVLEATNAGGAYLEVLGIDLLGAGGTSRPLTTAMGVVLPGSMRRWPVGKHPELGSGATLQLKVRTPSGEETIPAMLATR